MILEIFSCQIFSTTITYLVILLQFQDLNDEMKAASLV